LVTPGRKKLLQCPGVTNHCGRFAGINSMAATGLYAADAAQRSHRDTEYRL
jgi:hypothetical protein